MTPRFQVFSGEPCRREPGTPARRMSSQTPASTSSGVRRADASPYHPRRLPVPLVADIAQADVVLLPGHLVGHEAHAQPRAEVRVQPVEDAFAGLAEVAVEARPTRCRDRCSRRCAPASPAVTGRTCCCRARHRPRDYARAGNQAGRTSRSRSRCRATASCRSGGRRER